MYRAIDPRSFAFSSRLAFRETETRAFQLVARPGPRLPALQSATAAPLAEVREDLSNLVYIGASRDDQLALETELPQEGAPQRGVLTFAFEQGLTAPGINETTPAADLDGDGTVTVVEISSYLNSQVRLLSAQRQESTAHFPSDLSELPVLSASLSPRPRAVALPPTVRVEGGAATPDIAASQSWRVSDSPGQADFTWDRRNGDIVRRSGDIVASQVSTAAAFAGVIEKWQTILILQPLVSELRARMMTEPHGSDYSYGPGTTVTLTLSKTKRGSGKRYATVFNLASDGTVQLLYPLTEDGDGLLPASGEVSVLETEIVPPFGVDHIVAVTSPDEMNALRAGVRSASGQRAAGRLTGLIKAELKRARGEGSLAIAELYSGL
jgi:hypothetical protein